MQGSPVWKSLQQVLNNLFIGHVKILEARVGLVKRD